MKDVFRHVSAGGKEYPLAFNLNVIESVQDRYGSMSKFADALSPSTDEHGKQAEPKMQDVKFIYTVCINEGIEMENDPECQYYVKREEPRKLLTEKQVGRILGGVLEASEVIKNLVTDSNRSKDPSADEEIDDEEKN
jgi:hypothetical protein